MVIFSCIDGYSSDGYIHLSIFGSKIPLWDKFGPKKSTLFEINIISNEMKDKIWYLG